MKAMFDGKELTGGGAAYTAGPGVTIEGDAIRVTTPVAELTEEEYSALPEEQKRNGLYFLPDDSADSGSAGGGAFEEVYSTEETRIGTWFGKPLYRIAAYGTISSSTKVWQTIHPAIPDIVPIYMMGSVMEAVGSYEPLPAVKVSDNTISAKMGYSPNTGLSIYLNNTTYVGCPCVLIMAYTKTTGQGVSG